MKASERELINDDGEPLVLTFPYQRYPTPTHEVRDFLTEMNKNVIKLYNYFDDLINLKRDTFYHILHINIGQPTEEMRIHKIESMYRAYYGETISHEIYNRLYDLEDEYNKKVIYNIIVVSPFEYRTVRPSILNKELLTRILEIPSDDEITIDIDDSQAEPGTTNFSIYTISFKKLKSLIKVCVCCSFFPATETYPIKKEQTLDDKKFLEKFFNKMDNLFTNIIEEKRGCVSCCSNVIFNSYGNLSNYAMIPDIINLFYPNLDEIDKIDKIKKDGYKKRLLYRIKSYDDRRTAILCSYRQKYSIFEGLNNFEKMIHNYVLTEVPYYYYFRPSEIIYLYDEENDSIYMQIYEVTKKDMRTETTIEDITDANYPNYEREYESFKKSIASYTASSASYAASSASYAASSGRYKHKYLKYKQKYLDLKKIIDIQ